MTGAAYLADFCEGAQSPSILWTALHAPSFSSRRYTRPPLVHGVTRALLIVDGGGGVTRALPMIWFSNTALHLQALFYKKVQIMSFFGLFKIIAAYAAVV